MSSKLNELKQELEALVKKVQKDGKTDELEKEMDKMEAAINALKEEGVSEEQVKELKDLLDTVK
ncbi:MAG: hypothetical protein Q8M83_00750 [bacterium]|nr:hypothetical protein [bacterium]